MAKKKLVTKKKTASKPDGGYGKVLDSLIELLESARRLGARAVNSVMTATYWEIGRRIVEIEQHGEDRSAYGQALIPQLSVDLTKRFGRGFGRANLFQMRSFYLAYRKFQTSSGLSEVGQSTIIQTVSGQSEILPKSLSAKSEESGKLKASRQIVTGSVGSDIPKLAEVFPLSWSHYVRLLAVNNEQARMFYENEALRGGWAVRQLKRQIDSQFYERALLSKNKAAMLRKGEKPRPEDAVSADEEIKDPLVLEFLGLKDEYSESDLESGLIEKLEEFLLELGGDFTFVGRQKRLRIGDEWYRIDLLFYHRKLRCLVVIDLKVGKFTHADAGQMHMYLNYATEHWTHEDENPPVGLILCAQHDESLARYALDNLPTKVMAREYKLALPDEQLLIQELERTQRVLENRKPKTENSCLPQFPQLNSEP